MSHSHAEYSSDFPEYLAVESSPGLLRIRMYEPEHIPGILQADRIALYGRRLLERYGITGQAAKHKLRERQGRYDALLGGSAIHTIVIGEAALRTEEGSSELMAATCRDLAKLIRATRDVAGDRVMIGFLPFDAQDVRRVSPFTITEVEAGEGHVETAVWALDNDAKVPNHSVFAVKAHDAIEKNEAAMTSPEETAALLGRYAAYWAAR